MGLGITASAPCLAGILRMLVCAVHHLGDSENRLAKFALRGSSVLAQDFWGPQMGVIQANQDAFSSRTIYRAMPSTASGTKAGTHHPPGNGWPDPTTGCALRRGLAHRLR